MEISDAKHYSDFSLKENHGMRPLDYSELEEVNGGLGTVATGAIVGAVWNGVQYIGSGSPNGVSGFLMAAGSGALGGAIAGMGGFGFSFYGGGICCRWIYGSWRTLDKGSICPKMR